MERRYKAPLDAHFAEPCPNEVELCLIGRVSVVAMDDLVRQCFISQIPLVIKEYAVEREVHFPRGVEVLLSSCGVGGVVFHIDDPVACHVEFWMLIPPVPDIGGAEAVV